MSAICSLNNFIGIEEMMRSDQILAAANFKFERKFRLIFPSKKGWKSGEISTIISHSTVTHTNCSMIGGCSEAGEYSENLQLNISVPLGGYSIVSQAELLVIMIVLARIQRKYMFAHQIVALLKPSRHLLETVKRF